MAAMDINVYDTSLHRVAIIDAYLSLIWTERYSEYGDFELYLPATSENLQILCVDYYLVINESKTVMIIENIELKSDLEEGTHLTVSGRSLESILDRRIVWTQTTLTGNFQNAIKTLLNSNAISPSVSARTIPNLYFKDSTDTDITSLSFESAQFTGDNLYEAVKALCDVFSVGFKIFWYEPPGDARPEYPENAFVFQLYSGKDRSRDQQVNPLILFSPEMDNLINSNFYASKAQFKTVALVAGEGEGLNRRTITVEYDPYDPITGLARRELFVDARDISSNNGQIGTTQYNQLLENRGCEALAENVITNSFEGQLDAMNSYEYGVDYGMGDLVQMENEFGMGQKVRVTEFIRSLDSEGILFYPTFSTIE